MDSAGKKTLETMAGAKWYNQWLFSLMEEHLGGDILEVGAGIGNFTNLLAKKGIVTGIDIRKDYINNPEKDFGSRVFMGLGDVEKGKYFFRKKKFNTIICLNVLEHIRNEGHAIDNMFNLLKPGGKLILLVPAHKLLYSRFDKEIGHFRRYVKTEIRDLLTIAGFGVLENKYLNWWGAIGWLVWFKILGNTQMPSEPVEIFDTFGRVFLFPEKFVSPPFGLSVYLVAEKP